MLTEKEIDALRRELVTVRSRMEEIGPMVFGTLAASHKKYRTKDGKERICRDSPVLKFAGATVKSTVRIPPDKAKSVQAMIANGREWRILNKRHLLIVSQLSVLGALKKNS